ncbi:UNVERIFIED_CONTAM: hypothetical protein RF648_18025 [Kocuria sp. CPCC 205274]|uniref:Phage protein n=1 Tax=Herbiconiux daphne TaxID=2970914 RepID=A0ABT2H9D0_9MICO|nr:hypothetical protein [Herbiconiux daphne]MCS5736494.1 hypothetical protein [Herbiconiux daphne]
MKEVIIVGKQFKIASFGDKAALVDYYKQQLINKNDEIREKVVKIAKKDMTGFLYVDENRANYLTVMQDGK